MRLNERDQRGLKRVEATLRGFKCLTFANLHDGCSVAECARGLALPPTTTHRLLETLRTAGYLIRGEDLRYRVASKARSLSESYVESDWIVDVIKPELTALSRQLIWPVGYITPRGLTAEVRLIIEKRPTAILHWRPGSELPLHRCSGGLLYLSELEPGLLRDTVQALQATHPEDSAAVWSNLERRLEEVRQSGYAICRTTERESGLALPVRLGGTFIGGIGMQWITRAVKPDEIRSRYIGAMGDVAQRIEVRLAAPREHDRSVPH